VAGAASLCLVALGINIVPLLTLGSVGSLVVGLAAQNTISNLLSAIYLVRHSASGGCPCCLSAAVLYCTLVGCALVACALVARALVARALVARALPRPAAADASQDAGGSHAATVLCERSICLAWASR
jgi:hypothetical protein